ncbi:hypothetical protein AB0395_43945 [Streptosporangium sp. NPDC051023]|uniref:hypothetical protein n=1 Tax=Streptosporangium sp. NPDC051023 TaxID=3155410 RepID=UPI003450D27F
MEFLIILTLSRPYGSGFQQATITRTVTAEATSTRAGLLAWALKQVPQMQGANIMFFSAEPNALPATLKAVKG